MDKLRYTWFSLIQQFTLDCVFTSSFCRPNSILQPPLSSALIHPVTALPKIPQPYSSSPTPFQPVRFHISPSLINPSHTRRIGKITHLRLRLRRHEAIYLPQIAPRLNHTVLPIIALILDKRFQYFVDASEEVVADGGVWTRWEVLLGNGSCSDIYSDFCFPTSSSRHK
jgi:hypothetical protein